MHVPVATYRLQFTPSFGFEQAQEIIPYLKALGVSDVYASPIFQARSGSEHGYDVINPASVNVELGGMGGLLRLMQDVKAVGMGWLQDIVPNHMAFDPANPWLQDVLESGPNSTFYEFFDIDWGHAEHGTPGRLLTPFLGAPYAQILERGELKPCLEDDGLKIAYWEKRFPLAVETYDVLLEQVLHEYRAMSGRDAPEYIKLMGLLYMVRNLPGVEDVTDRADQVRFIKALLKELYEGNEAIRRLVDATLAKLSGTPDIPGSFDDLEALLSRQYYRLAFWKLATEEINYRRFFNINELISLRMERQEVFQAVHAMVGNMVAQGLITGLRIDHIDGLYDPLGYLQQLRRLAPQAYLAVEKILGPEESLPSAWPVAGATGYEFMNMSVGLFVESTTRREFDRIYRKYDPATASYKDQIAEKKRLVIGKEMAGDVENLAQLMKQAAVHSRHGSDISIFALKRVIVEVLADFPVYRSYISPHGWSKEDVNYMEDALDRARQTLDGLGYGYAIDFIEEFLLLKQVEHLDKEETALWMESVQRFQQLTGPLMAKGFEDTFLYCHARLLALNEVGGAPERFGVRPRTMHSFLKKRAAQWPHAMNATATHDTKRGEDTRMRLAVLSERPKLFEKAVNRWRRMNRSFKTKQQRQLSPHALDEFFLYQACVGSWPMPHGPDQAFVERLQAYMLKALREAKLRSSWIRPDEQYEATVMAFIASILDPAHNAAFIEDVQDFLEAVALHGIVNTLAQTVLKFTAPGMPDIYQGTELLDFSFVDPDNRRPVDYPSRASLMEKLAAAEAQDPQALLASLLDSPYTGHAKAFVTCKCLSLRQSHPALFVKGAYIPITAKGSLSRHVFAFARTLEHESDLVVVIPRLTCKLSGAAHFPLGDIWKDTTLALPTALHQDQPWRDVFSGKEHESPALPVADLFASFPVAVLQTGTGPQGP